MAKRLFLVLAATFCFATPTTVWAHGGRLDRHGCHHDRRAGVEQDYHCHWGPLVGYSFRSKEEAFPFMRLGVLSRNCLVVNMPDGGPDDEQCKPPVLGGPESDYFLTPPDMLDWEPTVSDGNYAWEGFRPRHSDPPTRQQYKLEAGFIGANEGRLRDVLRSVAQARDPLHSLCESARRFASNDDAFGNAFADLAVTGKVAFSKFVQLSPREATLSCQGTTNVALGRALDRAYKVASVIRTGTSLQERRALGWIAVSGEDDQPHRPVNVPSVSLNTTPPINGRPFSFPQFSLSVSVPGKPTVNTRYTIAHARPPAFRRPPQPLADGGPGREVLADYLPALAPDAEVILFIHGMDSRAEEALNLAEALHKLAPETQKNWTIISFDLPTSGYADNVDHFNISPTADVNYNHSRAVPLVDFIEDFIVTFVNTLGQDIPTLKSRMRAIVGGSLGGNMSMRLGRRHELRANEDLSWIRAVVPWSPASIWPSFANDAFGGLGHVNRPYAAVATSLAWSGGKGGEWLIEEKPQRRMELFYGGFDWRTGGFIGSVFDPTAHKAQADLWWRDGWACKEASKLAARLDRHETYDEYFRRWHWRLGAEQLLFSHWETIPCCQDPGRTPPLFWLNRKPMFLSCGRKDVGVDLCSHANSVATRMKRTPGYFRLLENTGHSMDNERPMWFARQIVWFLGEALRPGVPPQDARTCPADHPIKGNFTPPSSERCIYHSPSGAFYGKTKPERCYASGEEAVRDGCLASKR
jgi:hypothetical protein